MPGTQFYGFQYRIPVIDDHFPPQQVAYNVFRHIQGQGLGNLLGYAHKEFLQYLGAEDAATGIPQIDQEFSRLFMLLFGRNIVSIYNNVCIQKYLSLWHEGPLWGS